MRRVVVTGLGIVSSIGNNVEEVLASLQAGTSGIVASPEMAEHGFRSQIAGTLKTGCRRTRRQTHPCVSWVRQRPTPTSLWPKPLLTRV